MLQSLGRYGRTDINLARSRSSCLFFYYFFFVTISFRHSQHFPSWKNETLGRQNLDPRALREVKRCHCCPTVCFFLGSFLCLQPRTRQRAADSHLRFDGTVHTSVCFVPGGSGFRQSRLWFLSGPLFEGADYF